MTYFGVDYASGVPDYNVLKQQKVRFVCRYLSSPGNKKNITLAEAAALKAAGIGIVLVFETVADEAKGGYHAGQRDAQAAASQALAVGLGDAPIYFAVDFDATPQDQVPINGYLGGCASVLGKDKVGIYGDFYVVKRALDIGVCKYAWQTYAWSGGQWDPRAHIHQYKNSQFLAGIQVDFDEAQFTDFGQAWWPPVRKAPSILLAEKGWWAWVQWRLGEGDWKGWGFANPSVRPAVPVWIPGSWWARLSVFLARRQR